MVRCAKGICSFSGSWNVLCSILGHLKQWPGQVENSCLEGRCPNLHNRKFGPGAMQRFHPTPDLKPFFKNRMQHDWDQKHHDISGPWMRHTSEVRLSSCQSLDSGVRVAAPSSINGTTLSEQMQQRCRRRASFLCSQRREEMSSDVASICFSLEPVEAGCVACLALTGIHFLVTKKNLGN